MEENPTLYGKDDIEEKLTLMKEQSKIQQANAPAVPVSTAKKVGENKEGKPKQVNAGFQNSPEKKK